MKKIIYLIGIVALLFTSCNPMEDIYNDLDKDKETAVTGDTNFTMSDEDYAFLELNYGSFSSMDDAKTKIPQLLTDKYLFQYYLIR